MSQNNLYTLSVVAVVAIVTWALRALPFWVFRAGRPVPRTITYLGRVLPPAIMGMLIIYCLKAITPTAYPFGLPELIAVAITAGLHLFKRNTMLSIFGGTAAYMVLVQLVFA